MSQVVNDTTENDAGMTQARTAGQLLLAARKENNITVEYVTQELRLSRKLIESIEADQSEGLPETTYVRGYIRSYARLLGLDEEKVLDCYSAAPEIKDEWATKMPGSDGTGLVLRPRKTRIVSPFTLAALAVILGFLAWFAWDQDWFQLRQIEIRAPAVDTAPVDANSISATEAARAAMDAGSRSAPALSVSGEATATALQEPSMASYLPPPDPDAEVELTFEFEDTSWVDVHDRNGNRLMYRSYTRGEFERVAGQRPFSIFIGNAAAVQMTYAGQSYDVSPHRNGMYAKFELGQEVKNQDEEEGGEGGGRGGG